MLPSSARRYCLPTRHASLRVWLALNRVPVDKVDARMPCVSVFWSSRTINVAPVPPASGSPYVWKWECSRCDAARVTRRTLSGARTIPSVCATVGT
jgi:hypothetical protein